MQLVLITGMSGAGKSGALKTLEDSGFEAVDNIPLHLIAALVGTGSVERNLAVGVDIRSRDFSPEHFVQAVLPLRLNPLVRLHVVFLDCDDEVLRRRFTETRRPHPLADDRTVIDGIRHERSLLEPLKPYASLVLDTSDMTPTDLRRVIGGHFSSVAEPKFKLHVCSFSFKKGLPREADMVFDVRFLKNPHYDDKLRPLTGRDASVGAHIETDPDFTNFFARLQALLQPLLPRYREEGKSYLTIAIGCTGGRHRSVYVAEKLAASLEQSGYNVSIRHRDLE